jgi:putative heme-binding domain-containing protein
LTVAPGFKVELLKSAAPEEGSWICLAIDGKGRLYISPQGKPPGAGTKREDAWGGLWRVTLDKGHISQWDKVPVPVGDAMGMLWAFDSLYVSGEGPEGRGIYRLKDAKGSDRLDTWTLFKKVPGGNGEHGAHALVLGPDGKSIYVVHGNATPLIDGIAADSPFRNYAEDDLLTRVKDPVATFFDKMHSPYGYILKTDETGSKWDLFAAGLRNPYDIAFNADGELFTYDADMEWDVGLPWYRPTRILHIIAGGEYGFREGTAKWPEYYADSMPAVANIGLGCPTGVMFGTNSNFPLKYQRAFFVLDWTFGRILAIHFNKDYMDNGAHMEYGAVNPLPSPYHLTGPSKGDDVEEFLKGKGMPVTALVFGRDGAMYFTTGGRGTQAGLYRVSYVGSRDGEHLSLPGYIASANEARHKIEAFQTKADVAIWDPKQFDGHSIWSFMDGRSVAVRFAARVAVERQPVDQWRQQALEQKDPQIGLTALLALARVGTKDDQESLLKALRKFPLDSLSEDLKLQKLRVIEVALARQGRPNSDLVRSGMEELSRQYPAKTFPLNRELCELLSYLGAPDVVEKTLALMDKTEEPAEQIWYALCLREADNWTRAQREHYFAWFSKMQNYAGGNSAKKFILRIRDQALEKVAEADRPALLALAEKVEKPKPAFTMPARPFVKNWTMEELEPILGEASKGRDFAHGKAVFSELLCAQCHLFAGGGGLAKGGAVGPDLTAVGSRFSARDVVAKILDPSKTISDQYASFLCTMKDGSLHSGQVAEENHYLVTLIVDPFNGTKENIMANQIVKKEKSPVSLMPPGMLMTLSKEEILDLVAYLRSGGNEQDAAFKK